MPDLLQSLLILESLWTDISRDFIEELLFSHGKDVIFVILNQLSKCSHFIPLKHPYTALEVAQVFMDNVFKLHGLPKTIVSDRDPIFTSNFWQRLFNIYGTKLLMSSAYHPQTDGQTEVVNYCLEQYLRRKAGDKPNE